MSRKTDQKQMQCREHLLKTTSRSGQKQQNLGLTTIWSSSGGRVLTQRHNPHQVAAAKHQPTGSSGGGIAGSSRQSS
jgi:hypothetical protein